MSRFSGDFSRPRPGAGRGDQGSRDLEARIDDLCAELDGQYQPIVEQLVALNSRLDHFNTLLSSLDKRLNPGIGVIDRRLGALWLQISVVLVITMLLVIAVAIIILVRG